MESSEKRIKASELEICCQLHKKIRCLLWNWKISGTKFLLWKSLDSLKIRSRRNKTQGLAILSPVAKTTASRGLKSIFSRIRVLGITYRPATSFQALSIPLSCHHGWLTDLYQPDKCITRLENMRRSTVEIHQRKLSLTNYCGEISIDTGAWGIRTKCSRPMEFMIENTTIGKQIRILSKGGEMAIQECPLSTL